MRASTNQNGAGQEQLSALIKRLKFSIGMSIKQEIENGTCLVVTMVLAMYRAAWIRLFVIAKALPHFCSFC